MIEVIIKLVLNAVVAILLFYMGYDFGKRNVKEIEGVPIKTVRWLALSYKAGVVEVKEWED